MANKEGSSSGSQPWPIQGELLINIPKEPAHVELSREELISRAHATLLLFAEKAMPALYDKVRRGEGKQIISPTEEGRPGEELLDIDQTGENALKAAIREAQLPAIVISENAPEPHLFGNGDSEKLFVFTDPFDNTSQYKRGLDTPPYSVVSIWGKDGQPIGGVVGDIKNRQAYISMHGETFILDLETKERKKITKSERITLTDKNSTLATFLGENEYSLKFFEHFGKMIKGMNPKGILYGGGGAYIYGLLASGAVDAYVMFNEPLSEIIPGLPLALAGGCTAVSVNPDGIYQEFKFDPNALKENHRLYAEGSIPLFIAACTPQVRDEIISYYMAFLKESDNRLL